MLRKSKILKAKGIQVEEDLSRAAKSRRRELEKLMKNIKVSNATIEISQFSL